MHSFKNSKPLPVDEERKLIARAQRGDRLARERLIQCNLRFVMQQARNKFHFNPVGAELEDYVQEGLIALNIAIDKFNSKKCQAGQRLIGYAVSWIKVRQGNLALKTHSLVKYGTTQPQRLLFSSLRKAEEELLYHFKRDPTDEEIADFLSVKVKDVTECRLRLSRKDASTNTLVNDAEGVSYQDLMLSTFESPEEEVVEKNTRQRRNGAVRDALQKLDPREREIVVLRLMDDKDSRETLSEIGDRWGVSRERVRQLEVRAMEKLKELLRNANKI